MHRGKFGMNKKFWKNKKVFLTGHTGFKGSWLSLWLQTLGAELFGYALEPETTPNLFNIASVAKQMTSYFGNILDKDTLEKKISDFKPEIIIHMAAQPLVRRSYEDPKLTYQTNVMGTLNLLEALRKSKSTVVFINVTTDKCYENNEWHWGYRENEKLGGYDPYSSSKACSEILTSSYRNSFFSSYDVALATARAGNVIGGGDFSQDRLLPDFFKSLDLSKNVVIRNPSAIRPWQHVLCPLSGYLLLAERMFSNPKKYSEAWNFGPSDDDARNVKWIIEKLCSMPNDKKIDFIINKETNSLHEATYLKLDCSKARSELNWEPKMNLNLALKNIWDWHQAYSNNHDMHEFTLHQIKNY